MKAPEKIYLEKVYPDNGILPNGLNYIQSPNDIEYTRTDAFIEKACDYLQKNLWRIVLEEGEFRQRFVTDFEIYMKGE